MISYRKADINDIETLAQMRIRFIKEIMHLEDSDKDRVLAEELRRFFRAAMPKDRFIAWIAEEDGKVIGTSGLCFYTLAPSHNNMSGGVAYIQNMYTLPEYRGRGIAKVLFDKVLTEAKERGYKKISLHATEMGRPIYEKFGFTGVNNEMALNL
jgi:GNAT superfamily N-acetyltransferase